MESNYPHLCWIFEKNLDLKEELFEKFSKNSEYLEYLDDLASKLDGLDCLNVQEKIAEINDIERDFSPFCCELEVASYFAERGNKIQLLLNGYFKKKSPDILCENKKISSYIEVTSISNSSSTLLIIDELRQFLKKYPYCVLIDFDEVLSIPRLKYDEKRIQNELVERSLASFKEKIPEEIQEYPYFIETESIKFRILPANSKEGYPGIFNSGCKVPSDEILEYITYRLVEKAKKRESFPKKHQDFIYIVALVCDDKSIDSIDMQDLLYGNICGYPLIDCGDPKFKAQEEFIRTEWEKIIQNKSERIPKWKEIDSASLLGWNDLLIKYHLIPHDYHYLYEEGIYLASLEMKHVSGVLFVRKGKEAIFYPNPFCYSEINDPNICSDLNIE
ncbi:MAG TPA: hypothetical protein ENN44_03395 [Methanoculleus sp.]|nr:hypothetical protein [Methanoculleus sp.]